MTWQVLLSVVGALLAAEGVLLMTLRKESWKRFCEYLSAFSVGQVHTIGALMLAAGGFLLLLGA